MPVSNRLLCLFLFCMVCAARPVQSQLTSEESLKSLQAAEGVNVSLWAEEPLVNNPTAIDVDSRGRVWIAEGKNYRMKLRMPETMKRVEGADQIKILEDTDNDGRADKETIFADNIFPVPLGMAVEEVWHDNQIVITRVYVGNSPDFLVVEDTDGDNVADKRYALLSGFRGVDSDHGLHGMSFGPDGKVYFTVGDTRYGADNVQGREATFDVLDKSGRHVSANNYGTTLRMNRDGSQLEVLTSGHRNNYEAAINSFGQVFGSDNDDDGNRGCRMYWVMDGGRYGYQNPESKRHWAEELPGNIPKLVGTGNGSPAGVFVYEGHSLPSEYFGSVLQIDAGTHQINAHPVVRHGAAYRSDYKVLLKGNDDWFRPIDLAAAPDGTLFVCDWYDAGVGGNRFSDQTTGRIYRLSGTATDSATAASNIVADPIKALMSPNKAVQLAARDVLIAQGNQYRSSLLERYKAGKPYERARALYVLNAIPNTGLVDTMLAIEDGDPEIRELGLRLLTQDVANDFLITDRDAVPADVPALAHLEKLTSLVDDPDAGVRRTLLLGLRRAPSEVVGDLLVSLALQWDGQDRYYLEAIRSAFIDREPELVDKLCRALTELAVTSPKDISVLASPPFYPISSNDAFLKIGDELPPANAASKLIGIVWVLQRKEGVPSLEKLLKTHRSAAIELAATSAVALIADESAGKLLVRMLWDSASDSETRRSMLQTLTKGITKHWTGLNNDAAVVEILGKYWQDPEMRGETIEAIARAGFVSFSPLLKSLVMAESEASTERASALIALAQLGDASAEKLASDTIARTGKSASGGEVALAAIEVLKSLGKQDVLLQLLGDDAMPSDVRRRSLQAIASNYAGAEMLLKMRDSGAMPPDLENELRFLLFNHSDYGVRMLAKNRLPMDNESSGTLHDYQSLLLFNGDVERGRDIFLKDANALCARCHRIDGKGTLVGPDLSTIGTKYGARELLYHIQNPSGAINYNFATTSFLMSDGRAISGLVLQKSDDQITLGLATGEQLVIKTEDIEEQKTVATSIMPEGTIAKLSSQQVADLLEFLVSLRQNDAMLKTVP